MFQLPATDPRIESTAGQLAGRRCAAASVARGRLRAPPLSRTSLLRWLALPISSLSGQPATAREAMAILSPPSACFHHRTALQAGPLARNAPLRHPRARAAAARPRAGPTAPEGPGCRSAPLPRRARAPNRALVCRAAEISSAATGESVLEELSRGTARKYIMVSGKGGVGKTSLAASLGVRLAMEGHTVLVVSTDPAHSLGDSLEQDLSGGRPVPVEGTSLPLWGMEIDPEQAKEELRREWEKEETQQKVEDWTSQVGLRGVLEQLTDLKLGELLDTPPPGLDEAIAISKVVQFVNSEEYAKFTRIIFDTAPTGHTLRLLSLPDFLDRSIEKISRLRRKVAGAGSFVRVMFGRGAEALDRAVDQMEGARASVAQVASLFRDESSTEFVIATIPTVLAATESGRLLRELRKEGIPCKRMIINQVLRPSNVPTFIAAKLKDQARAMAAIESDPALGQLRRVDVDRVDVEVRGIPALQWFGAKVWNADSGYTEMSQQPSTPSTNGASTSTATTATSIALSRDLSEGRKFFMFGGKGGVGKTSLSASLAVKLASDGYPTLIVSTDPAHSLSDCLDYDVSGGLPVRVDFPGIELPLWGMQVDVEQARKELRDLAAKSDTKAFEDALSGLGMGGVAEQLRDLRLGELLDSAPPGVDEAVAISKVVQFLRDPEYAHFKRIVFDTAPTGHTLRLLSLPDFLDKSVGKVVRLRKRILDATAGISGVLGNLMQTGRSQDSNRDAAAREAAESALASLERLQSRMDQARRMFRDRAATEFVIVTIPTAMAVAESRRLCVALGKEGVPVKRLVVNQKVPVDAADKYVEMRRRDQDRAFEMFRTDPDMRRLQQITAPLIDMEVRGVAGLQYFGMVVWDSK